MTDAAPPKRRYLSDREKVRVCARQAWKCACGCGEFLIIGATDFDHALPLSLGGTNDLENFRALRKRHHLEKTKRETRELAKAKRIAAREHGRRKKLSKAEKLMQKMAERA